ncbi:MAG: E3 binding domain-containing protein [Gammaproteobacteria bacterium]|nr:E3 binding domain-containing protein [Gammaproteobacteria bacterium]
MQASPRESSDAGADAEDSGEGSDEGSADGGSSAGSDGGSTDEGEDEAAGGPPSPAARKLASEQDIDIAKVTGNRQGRADHQGRRPEGDRCRIQCRQGTGEG